MGSSNEWRAEEVIGGYASALEALRDLIIFPVQHAHRAQKLGHKWSRGLVLYGPPGTGKTSLVRAIVQESNAHLTVISPQSVHKAHTGESERVLREAFSEAASIGMSGKPSVIFVDEIDAICPRRDSRREQDVRLTSQLGILMDSIQPSSTSVPQVVVVAATNRVEAIDPALRRSGRFDAEVEVTTPNEEERFQILKIYANKLHLDPSVNLQAIAASCNGYVGADLHALCREAALAADRRSEVVHEDGCMQTIMEDWEHARTIVGPSITRGVTVEIPKVSWEDIGGLKDLKKKLQQAVEWPITHSAAFSRLGVTPVRGILLHGLQGCSKTTLAKAAAHAAQASFFALSGADLYSKYVGDGEALLRSTFQRAILAAPSIIFFDEADVIGAKRGGSSSNTTSVGERLLTTLLTEMDGLEEAKGILVLAATNRPEAIDAALMRPGRFDLVLYIPPPDLEDRYEILHIHTRGKKIESDVDFRRVAADTDLFTGAELARLCQAAGMLAFKENISDPVISDRHFQALKGELKPALTREIVDEYLSSLKHPSLVSSVRFLTSTKAEKKSRRKLFGSLFPVGVVVFIAVAAAKYFLMTMDRKQNGLATT